MPKFSPGDKVWYVPDHADGPDHKDAERGVVRSWSELFPREVKGNQTGYRVEYPDSDAPAPSNTKLTYERNLEPREE